MRHIAQQRDADLQDHYLYKISQYNFYQLIFVDEPGCDRRAGIQALGAVRSQKFWGSVPYQKSFPGAYS